MLDAFKLGVGHAVRVLDDLCGDRDVSEFRAAGALGYAADELRAYVATMTYEDLP